MAVGRSTELARQLAPGRVLTGARYGEFGNCISCGMDAEGSTLETWTFVGPTVTHPMCFWCLELWDERGWLK